MSMLITEFPEADFHLVGWKLQKCF